MRMRISDTELSRPYLSYFCRVVGVMTRHSGLLGTIGSDNSFRIILYFSKDFEEHVTLYMYEVLKHLLRYWPIFARSSTLHFADAVNTRQKLPCISITSCLLSFETSAVEVQSHILALKIYLRNEGSLL